MNGQHDERDARGAEHATAALVPVEEAKQELARELLQRAQDQGLELVGPDGLLTQLAGEVLQTALEVELTDHLGYERGQPRVGSNARNGSYPKQVQTGIGPVQRSPTRSSTTCRPGATVHWTRCGQWCSSTRCTSRSGTVRWSTGPSTSLWA